MESLVSQRESSPNKKSGSTLVQGQKWGNVECYSRHEKGHISWKCPKKKDDLKSMSVEGKGKENVEVTACPSQG